MRGGWMKQKILPKTMISPPHPTAPVIPTDIRTKTLAQRSSVGDLAPPSKPSGLDYILKLVHPRYSKLSKSTLKIAPSGAIVFTPARSQESLGSAALPAEIPTVRSTDINAARPQSTPIQDQHIPDVAGSQRSSSFESVRSWRSTSAPRTRPTEYERQRRYNNFLGRHPPPPVQRRSASLPRILEHPQPAAAYRQALFFGGPTNRPRPGYTKVPRFVPLEIRLNPSCVVAATTDDDASACGASCHHHRQARPAAPAEGSDDVVVVPPCGRCGCCEGQQRVSWDSSRSTRGGSDVPVLLHLSDEEGGAGLSLLSDSARVVMQAVGSRVKAVLGRGKENHAAAAP